MFSHSLLSLFISSLLFIGSLSQDFCDNSMTDGFINALIRKSFLIEPEFFFGNGTKIWRWNTESPETKPTLSDVNQVFPGFSLTPVTAFLPIGRLECGGDPECEKISHLCIVIGFGDSGLAYMAYRYNPTDKSFVQITDDNDLPWGLKATGSLSSFLEAFKPGQTPFSLTYNSYLFGPENNRIYILFQNDQTQESKVFYKQLNANWTFDSDWSGEISLDKLYDSFLIKGQKMFLMSHNADGLKFTELNFSHNSSSPGTEISFKDMINCNGNSPLVDTAVVDSTPVSADSSSERTSASGSADSSPERTSASASPTPEKKKFPFIWIIVAVVIVLIIIVMIIFCCCYGSKKEEKAPKKAAEGAAAAEEQPPTSQTSDSTRSKSDSKPKPPSTTGPPKSVRPSNLDKEPILVRSP